MLSINFTDYRETSIGPIQRVHELIENAQKSPASAGL
jgi:hypothetical protein